MKNLNSMLRLALSATLGTVFVSLLMTPSEASAGDSSAKLTVSATIRKHASLQVLAQPSSVVVTAADIAR
ncbi:MAG TPA: hypothetical protein VNN06_00660, partial [Ramlibacter sp.]|nr:hypothetical protein [Ramlibacter sp.]